jgi:hypothetical protein
MKNFLFALLGLSVIFLRSFLIFKLIYWLYLNYNIKNPNIFDIQWYVGIIVLDIYLMTLEKSHELDIYIKNDDEKNNSERNT